MLKPILYFFLQSNKVVLNALKHASCVNTIHTSYNLFCFVLFFVLFFFFFPVYPFQFLASWLGRLEPTGHPPPLLLHVLIVRGLSVRKTRRYIRS